MTTSSKFELHFYGWLIEHLQDEEQKIGELFDRTHAVTMALLKGLERIELNSVIISEVDLEGGHAKVSLSFDLLNTAAEDQLLTLKDRLKKAEYDGSIHGL